MLAVEALINVHETEGLSNTVLLNYRASRAGRQGVATEVFGTCGISYRQLGHPP